jgi:CRP-like cAMP-binding protein
VIKGMENKGAQTPVKEQVRLHSGVDFVEPFSEEELKELAERCPDIHFGPNEIFSTPRDDDGRFFVLKKGRVRVYKLGPEGQEQVVAEIAAGTGIAARRLYGSYAQILEPTTIASIGREELKYSY